MLDSFRKKDNKAGTYPRPQSAYSEMQQALSPATESRSEAPKTDVKNEAGNTQTTVITGKTMAAEINEAKVSKLIVGPDIKLKGAEITDCDTLVVEGRVEASMD